MQAELYWIASVPHGRLAIMPRPRAGDWLVGELSSLQRSGVDVVVSLLTDDEVADLDLGHEPTRCEELGLTFISYPIADRDVPTSIDDFLAFLDQLHDCLRSDCGVAVHCRMGIGRSSLVAACLMAKTGVSAADAFALISQSRGIDVPDTNAQIEWVASMVAHLRHGTDAG